MFITTYRKKGRARRSVKEAFIDFILADAIAAISGTELVGVGVSKWLR